ncbi:DUF2806 domain-containing protein [Vibrio splendidus]
MADGNSIINLGDLAKPATILIEKVSNAVGVLYEPRRIKKQAAAEVEAEKIKVLASIELSDIQQRGIDRLVYQEAKKQQNIEDITAQAAKQLSDEADVEGLEEDWVSHFFDKCEKVSDEQMQSLWSSLLSGEATKPGTYSKRTVDFISSMDKKDAELFTKFCQFTWMVAGPIPLIFDPSNEIYTKQGITFASLKHLDNIGLISFESMSGYRNSRLPKVVGIFYFGEPTVLEFKKDNDNELSIGKVLFTQVGKELVSICQVNKNEEFKKYVIEQVEKQGVIVRKST